MKPGENDTTKPALSRVNIDPVLYERVRRQVGRLIASGEHVTIRSYIEVAVKARLDADGAKKVAA